MTAYDATHGYLAGDTVDHDGATYRAQKATQGNAPPSWPWVPAVAVGEWQVVGDNGVPFTAGWQPFQEPSPAYRLEGDVVRLRGFVWRESGVESSPFVLPEAFRPPDIVDVPAVEIGQATAETMVVEPDGTITFAVGIDLSNGVSIGCTYAI